MVVRVLIEERGRESPLVSLLVGISHLMNHLEGSVDSPRVETPAGNGLLAATGEAISVSQSGPAVLPR